MQEETNLESLLVEKKELLKKYPHLLEIEQEIQNALSKVETGDRMLKMFEMFKDECTHFSGSFIGQDRIDNMTKLINAAREKKDDK